MTDHAHDVAAHALPTATDLYMQDGSGKRRAVEYLAKEIREAMVSAEAERGESATVYLDVLG